MFRGGLLRLRSLTLASISGAPLHLGMDLPASYIDVLVPGRGIGARA